MRHVAVYISGHGYGHATRCIELIASLTRKAPDLRFYIRTDAPKWLFDLNLCDNYTYSSSSLDVGTVQETSFSVNHLATLKRWQKLLKDINEVVNKELSFLRETRPALIIGDIPPLAFEIARRAEIPSVAVANFSWDWIYRDYVNVYPKFEEIISYISQCYRHSDLLLRLPFHGDLSAFPRIKDIPLIARKARRSKEQVKRMLKIDQRPHGILALVALRAADMSQVNLERALSDPDFTFITFGLSSEKRHLLNIPQDLMPFADLVNACDLVVSKPGYGIVSEIIANQTPLLYTSRNDFAEYPVLVEGLERYSVSGFLPHEDFVAGHWSKHLRALTSSPKPWPAFPIDGADRAAEQILSHLDSLTLTLNAASNKLSCDQKTWRS